MERQTFGTMQKVAKHTVNLLYGYARWFDCSMVGMAGPPWRRGYLSKLAIEQDNN